MPETKPTTAPSGTPDYTDGKWTVDELVESLEEMTGLDRTNLVALLRMPADRLPHPPPEATPEARQFLSIVHAIHRIQKALRLP